MPAPVFTFTDFGFTSSYLGQLEAAVIKEAPLSRVVLLQADAPVFNPRASAYLLSSLTDYLPSDSVVLAVVDPGVGSDRRAIAVKLKERWFVGPDNGLLAMMIMDEVSEVYEIVWQPAHLSSSFHGRDLFAVTGARLAAGKHVAMLPLEKSDLIGHSWPHSLSEVIYIDTYGNLVTGIPAHEVSTDMTVSCGIELFGHARTFAEVPPGHLFWYENANGLLEIAQNQGSAAATLGVDIGTEVHVQN